MTQQKELGSGCGATWLRGRCPHHVTVEPWVNHFPSLISASPFLKWGTAFSQLSVCASEPPRSLGSSGSDRVGYVRTWTLVWFLKAPPTTCLVLKQSAQMPFISATDDMSWNEIKYSLGSPSCWESAISPYSLDMTRKECFEIPKHHF